jgi:hypothetical protein
MLTIPEAELWPLLLVSLLNITGWHLFILQSPKMAALCNPCRAGKSALKVTYLIEKPLDT